MALAGAPRIARCEQNVVTEYVDTVVLQLRRPRRMINMVSDDLLIHRSPLAISKDERGSKTLRV